MDKKEILAKKKFSEIFELVQKETSEKRKELAEKFGMKGLIRSGVHSRAIVDLELENIRKMIDSKLQIDIDIFFKDRKPHTEQDEKFLKDRINNLYEMRMRASLSSLTDYFKQRGLIPMNDYFNREAIKIIADIKRKIEIIILENQISYAELSEIEIDELLKMDEGNQLEFKSTFQWDIRNQCKNEKLKMEVISTISAFNNTDGGYLLIGVDDKGGIFGLEKDYDLISKKNKDGFLQLITQEIENKISRDFLTKIEIEFYKKDKEICRIKVNTGNDAIWVKKNKNDFAFYIRTQNSTRALSPKEAAEYIRKKWPYGK